MPTYAITNSFTDGNVLTAAQLNTNFNDVKTFLNTTKLDADNIVAGSITNALVSTTAAIALSKLAAGTAAGQLIVTGAASTYTPAYQTITGDVTIGATGVTAVGAGKITNAMLAGSITYANLTLGGNIVNADISTTAAITVSKLAPGTSAQVLLSNATPTSTWTTLSGDVTVGATGTTAIGTAKVTNTMLAANSTYITETTSNSSTNVTTNTEVTVARTSFTAPASGRVKITASASRAGNDGTNGANTDVNLRAGTNATHASNGIVRTVRVGGFGASSVGGVPVTIVHNMTVTAGTTYYVTLTGGTSSGTAVVGDSNVTPAISVLVEAMA